MQTGEPVLQALVVDLFDGGGETLGEIAETHGGEPTQWRW
jgi:hypothetical protein